MRKEILTAVLVGSFLGLTLAFGIWRVNSALRGDKISATPTPTPTPEFGITVAKPENETVITESPVTFSGVTESDAWIVITTEEDDHILTADERGVFEKEVELSAGVNQVQVFAFNKAKASVQKRLILVFSTEFGKIKAALPTPTGSSETTESGIRAKVEARVQEALKNPKAYLGTVTDIVESTLQIKGASGEIKQAAASKDVVVIKATKTPTEVKFSDIAIGDFIVAMGFSNGNGVLDTKRILIISPPSEPKMEALLGEVSLVGKKDVTLKVAGGGEVKITPGKGADIRIQKDGKRVKIPFAEIEEGDTLIAIVSKDSLAARTILVITSK